MPTRQKKREKKAEPVSLARWIIRKTDTQKYRSGELRGGKHQNVDQKMLNETGGLRNFLAQAREMEQDPELGGAGLISFDWRDLGADIRTIHYEVDIVPVLCRKEKLPDSRKRQQKAIGRMEKFLQALQRAQEPEGSDVAGTRFAILYADHALERLRKGETGQLSDIEDDQFLTCLYDLATLQHPEWKRKFSARVFGKSKTFEQEYQGKMEGILRKYAGFEPELSRDELLTSSGILSYAQTLEWKGPLRLRLSEDGKEPVIIDTADLVYGTMINSQTMDHAVPVSAPGVRRILTIENKAVYESMTYDPKMVYVYCHGFFSPKESRFLQELRSVTEPGTRYLHWGDMDYGGIRIFRFIEKNIFPELEPYHMDPAEFSRLAGQVGIPISAEKREKLKQLDAGKLDALKNCILETGLEIEQEQI